MKNEVIECLMIDHDLGDENALNGYNVICMMLEDNIFPKEIQIVSMNSVGIQNICLALENAGYTKKFGNSNRIWVI